MRQQVIISVQQYSVFPVPRQCQYILAVYIKSTCTQYQYPVPPNAHFAGTSRYLTAAAKSISKGACSTGSRVYRGSLLGKYPAESPRKGSVRPQYPTEHSGKVRHELDTGARHFGKFGTPREIPRVPVCPTEQTLSGPGVCTAPKNWRPLSRWLKSMLLDHKSGFATAEIMPWF